MLWNNPDPEDNDRYLLRKATIGFTKPKKTKVVNSKKIKVMIELDDSVFEAFKAGQNTVSLQDPITCAVHDAVREGKVINN